MQEIGKTISFKSIANHVYTFYAIMHESCGSREIYVEVPIAIYIRVPEPVLFSINCLNQNKFQWSSNHNATIFTLKNYLKLSSPKYRPFGQDLNVLIGLSNECPYVIRQLINHATQPSIEDYPLAMTICTINVDSK